MKAAPSDDMCFALGRRKGADAWCKVTLGRQPFTASRGLLEDMVARLAEVHPNMEYKIQGVVHA
jgi:hypothetical protein